MSTYSRKETLVIVNPAAHNVPSNKRLDEAGHPYLGGSDSWW